MSKLKTKRKKHYLTAAMLAMLAIATPITLYGSMRESDIIIRRPERHW